MEQNITQEELAAGIERSGETAQSVDFSFVAPVLEAPVGPARYARNEFGLFDNVDYTYNEDGSVNWRAMVKPDFLYPNKDFFTLRKLNVPESIEGLDDKQLLIMLGGIKEIAKLRGFTSIRYEVSHPGENHVVAKCTIDWLRNYESDFNLVRFEDVANATAANTDDFCLKFLESIACNRAFVRCVRNYLNIHIVGADEIDKSKNRVADLSDLITSSALPITPQGTLEKAVNEKLKLSTFADFKVFLRPLYKGAQEKNDTSVLETLATAKEWNDFKDVPAKNARVLLKVVHEYQKDN